MKKCTRCKETKPLSEFSIRNASSDGLDSACRVCRKAYGVEYYKKDGIKARKSRQSSIRYHENRARTIEMFDDKCLDCDQWFPPNLYDIHHLEPEEKEYDICDLMARKWTENTDRELAKCIMLCPNCHRARHPGGWNVAG